jgi:uncharacterized OB-fold protein
MVKMISCKACGKEIAYNSAACPHCGQKQSQTKTALTIIGAMILFVMLMFIVASL